MDVDVTNFKILLLVDLDSCVFYDGSANCALGTSINAVRVSALKLLHFYMCIANSKKIPFQWSYKIYTHDKPNIHNVKRQSCFQDLNLQNFEAFESNLEADYSYLNSKGSGNILDDPCDILGQALQDVVVFFPWTVTGLQSPVRRRSFKQSVAIHHENGNLIFLFSYCPKTAIEVKHFAGKMVPDAKSLLELFATAELQRKLTDLCCVTLVDLRSSVGACQFNAQNPSITMSEDLMKKAFSLIKGKLVPVSSLMCLSQPPHCHFSNFLTGRGINSSVLALNTPVYPVSTTLGGYLHYSEQETTLTCKLIFTFHGDDTSLDVDVVNTVTNRSNRLFASVCKRSHQSNPIYEMYGVSATKSESVQPNCDVCVYNQSSERKSGCRSVTMKVVGVLPYAETSFKQYSTEEMYMVSPHAEGLETYVKQMSYFTKHHMIQVCEVCVSSDLVLTGLLQPLTTSSALLSIMSGLDHACQLDQTMIPVTDGITHRKELIEFVRKSAEHITQKKMPKSRAHMSEGPRQPICDSEGDSFSAGLLEDYYIPGSISIGAQCLQKVTQSDAEASEEEGETMRLLQKAYIKHKARRLTDKRPTRTSPRKPLRNKCKLSTELTADDSTPVLRRSPRKKPSTLVLEDQTCTPMLPPVLPPKNPLRRTRSHTAPTRRDVLWDKCRENIAKQKQKDSSDVATKKADCEKTVPEALPKLVTEDLQTKEALVEYLQRSYEDILEGSTGVLSSVHTLINMTLHFTQIQQESNPQQGGCDIMGGCLIKTVKEIKAKNKDQPEKAFREYELQVLLQMELETMLRDGRSEEELEEKAEQLAALLRAMSFSQQSGFNMDDYLGKYLLDSYVESLPLLLGKLYEEFLLPLPPQLEGLFSPEFSATSSVASHVPASVLPPSVNSNSSDLPASNRPRRDKALKRYTSFHSVSSRQIQLPQQEKKKGQKEPPRRSARTASTTKTKASASKEIKNKTDIQGAMEEVQGDVQKISKNLFGSQPGAKKLERSKFIGAVEKQCLRKTPRKNSNRSSQKTPKVHHVLKSRRVTETPSHKQKSKALWSQQEKARRRTLESAVVQTVEESPGKALVQANKKTPKKGALMKRKSFYSMTDDARNKFEKLEARMKNKILSPTWNASKKLSKLTSCMTSPRRVHPRTLFSNFGSPSPKKPLGLIKTPDRRSRTSSHFPLNSPSLNTRSQTSEKKRHLDSTRIESLTPRKRVKMNLFQSPSAGETQSNPAWCGSMLMPGMKSPLNVTPKKQRSLTFMSPMKLTPGKMSTAKCPEPALPFKKPCNLLNSPGGINIKGILSPAKRTQMKHPSLSFGSPLKCTPKKSVVLNLPESPFPVRPGQDLVDCRELPSVRHTPKQRSNSEVIGFSASPAPSFSRNVFQCPRPDGISKTDSPRPLTRSVSKMFPGDNLQCSSTTWKARANLSSLFSDDANDGFSLTNSNINKNIGLRNENKSCEQTAESTSTQSEHSSESHHIQRRTLSSQSKRRITRKGDSVGSPDREQGSGCNQVSTKRKYSVDETPTFSFSKRSRNSVYSEEVPHADQSQDYLVSDEVFLGSGRASEKPSTKSTLCSDQSNSRMSVEVSSPATLKRWEGLDQLHDVTNCDSNLSVKSLPAVYMNSNAESLDSIDSPVFQSGHKENFEQDQNSVSMNGVLSAMEDKNTAVSSLFKGVLKKKLHKTLSGHTDSSMSGAPSPVFDTAIPIPSDATEVAKQLDLESVFSTVNVETKPNLKSPTKRTNLPKPIIRSPLKVHENSCTLQKDQTPPNSGIKLKSPGTTPQRVGTRRTPGKSPTMAAGRLTPMCSPMGSTRYSPLTSTKSLHQLMESPLFTYSADKRKKKRMWGTPTSHEAGNVHQSGGASKSLCVEDSNSGTETRRQTRRSLYRTQTNQGLNE